MFAEVIDSRDNEIQLRMRDEDISILYIIQHELLKEKSVDFAGVFLKHPLVRDFEMRITTKRKDPMEVLQDSSTAATDYAKDLLASIKTALKK
jgi:DNA-directed RNA polymerase subunit L